MRRLRVVPPGHNFNDVLTPWKRRIRDVMDIRELGYEYSQPIALKQMVASGDELRALRRSPFWAD